MGGATQANIPYCCHSGRRAGIYSINVILSDSEESHNFKHHRETKGATEAMPMGVTLFT